jgi:hypothetical protein
MRQPSVEATDLQQSRPSDCGLRRDEASAQHSHPLIVNREGILLIECAVRAPIQDEPSVGSQDVEVRPRSRQSAKRYQKLGLKLVVGIQERHEIAGGMLDPEIARSGSSNVRRCQQPDVVGVGQ